MQPEEMSISAFKATCLAAIERVRRTGRAIVVTRHGTPVATVGPAPADQDDSDWLGSLGGRLSIEGDIISPPTDPDDWDVLKK